MRHTPSPKFLPPLRILTGLAAAIIGITPASSQILNAWNTNGNSGITPDGFQSQTVAPNMLASQLSRGSGVTASSLSNGFAATGWNSASLDTNKYFEFFVEAADGFAVSLDAIEYRTRRTSTGPTSLRWAYSTDGSNFTFIGGDISYTSELDGFVQTPVTLSDIGPLQDQENRIIFRLYGWGASQAAGSLSFGRSPANNDLVVLGTVAGDDTTEPTVVSLTPSNGAEDVPVDTTLTITFNEPVQAGEGDVILYQGDTVVETFAAADGDFLGNSVTFTPDEPLELETAYHVIVEADAFEDLAGNPFDGLLDESDWAFTTVGPIDTTPVVASLTPANGATRVSVDTDLVMVFDQDVTAGSGNVSIYEAATDDLVESIPVTSGMIDGDTLTISLPDPLDFETTYYVLVDAGVVENANEEAFAGISSETEWVFTTAFDGYFVDFEGAGETKTSFASGTVSLSGLNWDLTEVLIGTLANDWKNGVRSARLRGRNGSAMTMLQDKPDGAGTISFFYRRYGADGAQQPWQVEYSTNQGVDWFPVGSPFTAPASDVVQEFSEPVTVAGNVRFRIRLASTPGTSGDRRLNIDDIRISNLAELPALEIVTLTPENNAVDVPVGTSLSITFNQPVLAGTGNLVIYDDQDQPVEDIPVTSGMISGNTLTATLQSPLIQDVTYYVLLAEGAVQRGDQTPFQGITSPTAWTFTTEPPDTGGPVPLAFDPENGAINVPLSLETLVVTFDRMVYLDGLDDIEIRRVDDDEVVDVIPVDLFSVFVDENELIFFATPDVFDYDTEYYVYFPAGTVVDAFGFPNAEFGLPLSSKPWTFTTVGEPEPPIVVVNKYLNGATGNSQDVIELLVIGDEVPGSTVDMRGMIVKDFSNNMDSDSGGKFEFSNATLWEEVPVGTLVVLRTGSASADTDPGDYKLDVGLDDTTLFTNAVSGFDIGATEMVMIKAAGSGADGVSGGIHALAAGNPGAQFNAFTGFKLIASATAPTGTGVIANNSTSSLADFIGTDATGGVPVANITFGAANNSTNAVYINLLRGLGAGDGIGEVVIANTTAASPLSGTRVFGSGLTGQSATITVNSGSASVSLESIEIEVPADFGVPTSVSLSGAGATGASFGIDGQTVTISDAAVTLDDEISIVLNGLTTPSTFASGDYGVRQFVVSTAGSGGTLTPIPTSPSVSVVIPILNLREVNANGVPLALNQVVAVEGVALHGNFGTSNTQSNLQDETAGIALFNGEFPSPFTRGNRYILTGAISQFNGLTQLNYGGAANVIDLGPDTEPAPVVLTIPALLGDAERYEGSLVTVENLFYDSGTWGAMGSVTVKDADDNELIIRIQGGSTATAEPEYPVTITGVISQFDNLSPFTSFYQLMPRDSDDLVPGDVPPPADDFAAWIAGFDVGAETGPFETPMDDGVPNILKHVLGLAADVAVTGSLLETTGADAGPLTFVHTRIKPSKLATDVMEVYEWSTDLVNWAVSGGSLGGVTVDFVLAEVLDESDPEFDVVEVTATVSEGSAEKLFVRLGAAFVAQE